MTVWAGLQCYLRSFIKEYGDDIRVSYDMKAAASEVKNNLKSERKDA